MELLILVRLRPEIQCTRGLTRTPAAEYKNRDFHNHNQNTPYQMDLAPGATYMWMDGITMVISAWGEV